MENKNAKIAILLTGHVRQNNINIFMSQCDYSNIDIFIHTWDDIGIKGNERDTSHICRDESVEKIIKNISQVKDYKIECNRDFYLKNLDEVISHDYFNHSSEEIFIYSQLYSIKTTCDMMQKYAEQNKIKYDVVIKFRFDTFIEKFYIDDDMINILNNHMIIFNSNTDCHNHPDANGGCNVCNHMFYDLDMKIVHDYEHSNIICDYYAYGSVESMKHYCSMYDIYIKWNDDNHKYNMSILEKMNMQHEKIITKIYPNGSYNIRYRIINHHDAVFYFKCSFPERLLKDHLKNYMVVKSDNIVCKLQL